LAKFLAEHVGCRSLTPRRRACAEARVAILSGAASTACCAILVD
jgi:hypothetical protein